MDPQTVQKQVVEEINTTIKEVAKSKGYTLVFPPSVALYAEDESKDITEKYWTH
ncbi:outer membrane protein [Actinobacillus equuli]|nr:outer membrane protein [Actinobacillus equuli]